MTEDQYKQYVKRLQRFAVESPALFHLKILGLVALGYLFIPAIILCMIALALVAFFSGMIVGVAIYGVFLVIGSVFVISIAALRALKIHYSPPAELELKRHDAPALFAMVQELTGRLGMPQPHHILLTGTIGAALIQHARFGALGWQRNYLCIGLPLLYILSPEQTRTVLIHELGHLAGQHGRFSAWIARVQVMWNQFMEELEERQFKFLTLFKPFYNWFVPFFDVHAFVLARLHEIEADRVCMEIAGRKQTAQTLLTIRLFGQLAQDSFWEKELSDRVETESSPPEAIFSELITFLTERVDKQALDETLQRVCAIETDYFIPHLCPVERMASCGFRPQCLEGRWAPHRELTFPRLPETPAVQSFFQESAIPRLLRELNTTWRLKVMPEWKSRHNELKEARQKLRKLSEVASERILTVDEAWERAVHVVNTEGVDAAVSYLHEVLAIDPKHTSANFVIGQHLLGQKDAAGVNHLRIVMDRDLGLAMTACGMIHTYLTEQGNTALANQYEQWAKQHQHVLNLALAERENFSSKDMFVSHDWTVEEIVHLRDRLSEVTGLVEAYLVKKVVKYFPEEPCYVLGLVPKQLFGVMEISAADGDKLAQQVLARVNFTHPTVVVPLNASAKHFRAIFARVPNSVVFSPSAKPVRRT